MANATGIAIRRPSTTSVVRMLTFISALTAGSALSNTYTWDNLAGGSFQTMANWSPNGLPGSADTVVFGTPTTSYSVTSTGNVSTTGLQVSQGTATLALTSGQTYAVTGPQSFSVGTTNGETASLKITGGTLSLTDINSSSNIGPIAGAKGEFTVDGSGTTFTTNGGHLEIGVNGTGKLTVQNGATASTGNATLAQTRAAAEQSSFQAQTQNSSLAADYCLSVTLEPARCRSMATAAQR